MKIQLALVAGIAATVLGGSSFAVSLSDVIQKGANADKVMEKNQINWATAKAIGEHCINEAAAKGMGVSVVILDQFGTITFYGRGDGQGKVNTESALWKANTVLHTRAPSKAQMNAVRTGAVSESRVIWQGNFANAGGLPIVVDGQFLGAIGVGGMPATPPTWSDEICGHNALTAVLGPQPKLLPDLPNPFAISNGAAGGAARPAPGAANR
ncbi:MAG: heme-binding protein [Alphaproteobacteria bacterium]|nr:heme-binding protein [Alphaproteobacteria bacterium]